MDSTERKAFWDTLCSIRGNTPEQTQMLASAIKLPRSICRFRTVSESSLTQLQENKLYYSSADYYDDPFDTFIHFDYVRIKALYSFLCDSIGSNNPDILKAIEVIGSIIGITGEQYLKNLKESSFDITLLPDRIKHIRTIIQKNLFSICFCDDIKNETLWLKYANNYKGFALVYDIHDQNTFLCGKEEICKNCRSRVENPSVYPVYYTEDSYDATQFALACLLWGESQNLPPKIMELSYSTVMWEAERISLIKKKCHEYDKEWRMIRPSMAPDRKCIKMKPQKVILGLRMPEYERLLVISAAKVAGIDLIEEQYIDESDCLSSKPISINHRQD